jgi:glycerol-3-phosphate dehydrogenase
VELAAMTRRSRPFLSESHAMRLVRAYGTRLERILGPARSFEELGPCLGEDLTAAEVRYLVEQEWAQTADDVLWRRTKLGLRFSSEERARLADMMSAMIGGPHDSLNASGPSRARNP